MFCEEGRIIIQYTRRTFTGTWFTSRTGNLSETFTWFSGFLEIPRRTNIPPITEAQAEALDTIHFIAEKNNLGMNFQKGDIQYINNLGLFHGRDGFTDDPEKPYVSARSFLSTILITDTIDVTFCASGFATRSSPGSYRRLSIQCGSVCTTR